MIQMNGAMWFIGRRFVFKMKTHMPNWINGAKRKLFNVDSKPSSPSHDGRDFFQAHRI